METSNQGLSEFYKLSAALTGFSEFDLQGAGVGQLYFQTVSQIVGEATLAELLLAFKAIESESGGDPAKIEQGLRVGILSDPKLGPIARNIIKMWYLGSWYELPSDWREVYGKSPQDLTFVVSSQAYLSGLVWKAMQAHPMGGNQQGFGAWAEPPPELG